MKKELDAAKIPRETPKAEEKQAAENPVEEKKS